MSFNLREIKSKLIVSCQAPSDSPLHQPGVITAIAAACIHRGAAGVRLDTPAHVRAVRQQFPQIPIIGLWKRQFTGYEIYITPRFQEAKAIASAGADIIAVDATPRARPEGETLEELIQNIKEHLGKLVMADVDTLENAIIAVAAGADLVGTTLYGYTPATQNLKPPGFNLLREMVAQFTIPVICEGGISSPEEAKQALDFGAYAVVVGTDITGIDIKVDKYCSLLDPKS